MAHLTITADQKWVSPDTVGLLSACINQPSRHHPVYLTAHSNGSLPPSPLLFRTLAQSGPPDLGAPSSVSPTPGMPG